MDNEEHPIQVLHVDDDSNFLVVAKRILEQQGSFNVESVLSVEEAYAKMGKNKYDVVVSDYQMPIKDGLEFLKELSDDGINIPFILFTGKGREDVAIESLNLGADYYINKLGKPETVYGELAHALQQISKRKKAEKSLIENEEKFRLYVNNSPSAVFVANSKAEFEYVNETASKLLGYSRKELLEMSVPNLYHETDKTHAQRTFSELRNKGKFKAEVKLKHKNSEPVYVNLNAVKLPNGKLIAFCEDITGRKKAEETLRIQIEESRILSDLLSTSEQPFGVSGLDGSLVRVNPAFCKLTGYSEKELLEQKDVWINKLTPEKWRKNDEQQIATILKTKKPVRYEKECLTKNGKIIPIELFVQPKYSNKGEFESTFAFITDITKRKKAEKELEKIFDLSPDMVCVCTTEGGLLKVSPSCEQILGYTQGELLKIGWSSLVHPDDVERTNKEVERQLKGSSVVKFVNRYRHKNGSYVTLEWQASFAEKGIVHATARDITERKKMELELIKNKTHLQHMLISSSAVIYSAKPSGDYPATYISENVKGLTGYESADFTGDPKFWINHIHPEELPLVYEEIQKLFKKKRHNYDYRFKCKDGSYKWINDNMVLLHDEKGEPKEIVGYWTDISENRKTNEEMRNRLQFESIVSKISANLINAPTSELDKTISEALKIICQFVDAERGSIFLFSDNCTKLTNTHEWCSNPKDSQMSLLQGVPVETFGYYFNILKKLKTIVINRPDDLPNEAKNERKWSEEHGFRPLIFVPMIHNGALYGTVGYYGKMDKEQVWSKDAIGHLNILSDIFVNAMEHKRFEEEIKGLAKFPSENPNPVFRIAKDGTILYSNKAAQLLISKQKPDEKHRFDKLIKQSVFDCLSSCLPKEVEIKVEDKIFSFVFAQVVESDYVNVYGRDVTEHKKAEEELKEKNVLLDGILENTHMMAVYLDSKFNFIFVNKAYAKTCKHPQDFFVGKNHFDVYPSEEVESIFQNVVDTKEPFFIERRPFEFPDQPERGTTYWDWSLIPITDTKNEVTGLVFTLAEVTGKIKAENETNSALVELALVNEKLSVVGKLTRHDVRNKMSSVMGNIYLAKQNLHPSHVTTKYLKHAESEIDQIEKIFNFARMYEQLGMEELSTVDVCKSFDGAVSLLPDLGKIEVVNDCKNCLVLADSLLGQLFYNLMDNSLTHGENVSKIRLCCKTGKDILKLVYEDDGVGIPVADKEKIFVEGYGKGTGLGLHMIQLMCNIYGWTIKETGKQGKGAQFTITIPKDKYTIN